MKFFKNHLWGCFDNCYINEEYHYIYQLDFSNQEHLRILVIYMLHAIETSLTLFLCPFVYKRRRNKFLKWDLGILISSYFYLFFSKVIAVKDEM